MSAVNPSFQSVPVQGFVQVHGPPRGLHPSQSLTCLTWNALKINEFRHKRQTLLNSQENILVLPRTGDLLVTHQLDQRYSWAFISYNKTSLSHEDTQHSLPAHSSCLNPAMWIKISSDFFFSSSHFTEQELNAAPLYLRLPQNIHTHSCLQSGAKRGVYSLRVWWSEAR